MKRLSTVWMAAAALSLSGCLDDGGTLKGDTANMIDSRTLYTARSLTNYAFATAAGTGVAGKVQASSTGDFQSMLCPYFDGTNRGVFLAWPASLHGLPGGGIAGKVAALVSPDNVSSIVAGELSYMGQNLAALPGCEVPPLTAGTPVVIVPLNVPASMPVPSPKEELRAVACPAGYAGNIIERRTITFTATAATATEWQTQDMGGCILSQPATVTAATKAAQPWPTGRATPQARLLQDQSPETCRSVTVQKGDAAPRTWDNCPPMIAAAPELEPATPPPPGASPPPREYPCTIYFNPQGVNNDTFAQELHKRGFEVKKSLEHSWSTWVAGANKLPWSPGAVACHWRNVGANPKCGRRSGNIIWCKL